jgi:2,3-bisphosphoglycerate-dependent phosphoglycerate mutase
LFGGRRRCVLMSVGFKVGSIIDEVGTPAFLHAFFSTISYHLEPEGWGSRFPEIMGDLYGGKLDASKAEKALTDVHVIRQELKAYSPEQVVWDIENPQAAPPWGNDISSEITDLSNYFVTSTGRDLFGVLIECLTALQRKSGSLTIESY